MPLPADLASVAWLAVLHSDRPDWRPAIFDRYHWSAVSRRLSPHAARILMDLRLIVRTQQSHIASLEAQLIPHLVHVVEPAEQSTLA